MTGPGTEGTEGSKGPDGANAGSGHGGSGTGNGGIGTEGIGRPNHLLTTDYGGDGGCYYTLHMRIDLKDSELKAVTDGLVAAKAGKRTALKDTLKKILRDRYPSLRGGKQLIDAIGNTEADDLPNDHT